MSHPNSNPRLLIKRHPPVPLPLQPELVSHVWFAGKAVDHGKRILSRAPLEVNSPHQTPSGINHPLVNIGADVTREVQAGTPGEGKEQRAGSYCVWRDLETQVLGWDLISFLLEDEITGGGRPDGRARPLGGRCLGWRRGGGQGSGEGEEDG